MSRTLPPRPSLEQLRKQAKDLLKAHKAGDPSCCPTLRRLDRLKSASDAAILGAKLKLDDCQFALAMAYGFKSWAAMKATVERATPPTEARPFADALVDQVLQLFASFRDDDLHQRSEIDVLQILLHVAGRTEVDYATLMAVSGWSGQFVYIPKPDWPTFVSPGPAHENACTAIGAQVEHRTPKSAEEAMAFIGESVRQGQPVQVNYMEDGLFADFAEEGGQAKAFFMCIPFVAKGEWWTIDDLRTKWWDGVWSKQMHRIVGLVEPADPRATAGRVMADLVRLATVPYWNNAHVPGVLTGLAAIERYAADIADRSKVMVDGDGTNRSTSFFARGWGCFAIYPQWTARECTARYLDGVAALFENPSAGHVRAAASLYHEAYQHWREWERHLGRKEVPDTHDACWADPAHRASGSAAARKALASERKAIAKLKMALIATR